MKKDLTFDDIEKYYSKKHLNEFIIGHLAIETILNQLIEIKLIKPNNLDKLNLSFNQKIELLFSMDLFSDKMVEFLKCINSYRNKFAHDINFNLDFQLAFNLVNIAATAGIDFSDDGIYNNKQWSQENYNVEGIVDELFRNTIIDLGFLLEELGGSSIF